MNERYRKEIDDLYLQMYHLLFEYARSSLSNDSLAEEAVQDTFCIACQKPEALCESQNPKGWLVNALKYVIANTERSRTIANRILRDYFASQLNEISASDDLHGVEILYGDIAESDEFQLLKEMALDGRSHLEMAQKRGISVMACRKRMQRAKEFLREKICLDVTD